MNENILFYAFRYALGRMTYAVGEVANEIIRRAPDLSPGVRGAMIRDIDEAYSENRLGMEFDKSKWLEVRNVLGALVELNK